MKIDKAGRAARKIRGGWRGYQLNTQEGKGLEGTSGDLAQSKIREAAECGGRGNRICPINDFPFHFTKKARTATSVSGRKGGTVGSMSNANEETEGAGAQKVRGLSQNLPENEYLNAEWEH